MNDSKLIGTKLYVLVEKAAAKNDRKIQANIANYINSKHEQLYDIAPYDRIYFNQNDVDNFWNSVGLKEQEAIAILQNCFFWDISFNPGCVKEPYVMTLMMIIKYYLKKAQTKKAEITAAYLAFSGKFYVSIHSGIVFPKVSPGKYRTVMDYVVNNMLNDKYDLKREGTVFGAVMSMCKTWLAAYGQKIKTTTSDRELCLIVQQLRDREKQFLLNIAKLYYEAYENRSYLNYETDSLDPDEFHITSNDAATAARITENTISYMTSHYVSIDTCNDCKDANVKATEIKDIMESILADKNNLDKMRRLINIYICDFMRNNPGKRVGSMDFVAYGLNAKPNSKDPLIIESREILTSWLDENSPNYRRRRSRQATEASYRRSLTLYILFTISKVCV